MSTLTVKELAAPTGYDLKIASGDTLDLKSQGTVTMPTGSVVQVKQAGKVGEVSTASTTFVKYGMEVSITPKATSSKILILVVSELELSTASDYAALDFYRKIGSGTANFNLTGQSRGFGMSQNIGRTLQSLSFLDSPNTTDAVVYDLAFRRFSGSGNIHLGGSGESSYIQVMEVAG